MPVDFLTNEQQYRYGRYADEPTPDQLARYFHLDDADRTVLASKRGPHNRLGFALQLGTVRFLGTFLSDPTDVPANIVSFMASQLRIADPQCLERYMARPTTHWDHADEIKQTYGYKDFNAQPGHFRLVRWLYTRAWLSAERPSVLFDLATAWLVERKILLPGATTLARLIASVRDRVAVRLWRTLFQVVTPEQQLRLEQLLTIAPGERQSPLDRLRHAPTHVSANEMVRALQRLKEIRTIGAGELDLSAVPPSRLMVLARYAASARAQAITRMPEDRRIATLLAFICSLEVTAQDDAVDLLDLLIQMLLARAARVRQKERLRTLRDLDAAALQLREACLILLDATYGDEELRRAVFTRVAPNRLEAAIATIGDLAHPKDDSHSHYADLLTRYTTVRRFLPLLLETTEFKATEAGKPVLEAWQFLRDIEGQKKPVMRHVPREVVSRPWRRYVYRTRRQIDRKYYTLCTLERLQDALRKRDVFLPRSERWGDPRAKLLQGQAWERLRSHVCHSLQRELTPEVELQTLANELGEAYRRTAENLATNSAMRIEPSHISSHSNSSRANHQNHGDNLRTLTITRGDNRRSRPDATKNETSNNTGNDTAKLRLHADGHLDNNANNVGASIHKEATRDSLVVAGLDRLEDPASLKILRQQIAALLPRVDLPELMLEVQEWTGFAHEFTHLSEGRERAKDLPLSICAVLLAQACNIGLEPLVRQDIPALTRSRLSWVQQNYIRTETLIQANARLVDYHAHLPLAQEWGGGEVASADGLRFVVPVRTLNARPNSKYFGVGRGVTLYNFTSDQFTGFHAIVIPGTIRDSLYILDGLLEQQTSLRPTEIMSDTAGYSDLIFGLFWLLGYQFSPRLADVGEARFWRMDAAADYGPLNGVARNRINTGLISRNWDDLLRVAGSLKMGVVSASALIRSLHGGSGTSRPSTLARAIGELGRIVKTLYLLAYVDDETYRRRILIQLNRGEARHSLARVVFHGQKGELRQRYREGQEDQLGALGLVINMIVLWNTRYMQVALDHLRIKGTGGISSTDRTYSTSEELHGQRDTYGVGQAEHAEWAGGAEDYRVSAVGRIPKKGRYIEHIPSMVGTPKGEKEVNGEFQVRPEDLARLSPLAYEHINMLGRYHFSLSEPLLRGQMRPLRDPADPEEQLEQSA